MLNILLIFMVIDFVSGFIKAWALKEFDSSKFYIGGVKKIGILLVVALVVAVAAQLDQLIRIDSTQRQKDSFFRSPIAVFQSININFSSRGIKIRSSCLRQSSHR